MNPRILGIIVLSLLGTFSLGAKCVKYVWTSPDDAALYAHIRWRDTDLGPANYAFTPDYPARERAMGDCRESNGTPALVQHGVFACTAYVLDVDTPSGTVTISDIDALRKLIGPIESEAEAASFAKATIGGYAHYDGATAETNGNFLVRMADLRDNCSPTAGFYAIAYEVTPDGQARIVAEEARRPASEGGGALCYD